MYEQSNFFSMNSTGVCTGFWAVTMEYEALLAMHFYFFIIIIIMLSIIFNIWTNF